MMGSEKRHTRRSKDIEGYKGQAFAPDAGGR